VQLEPISQSTQQMQAPSAIAQACFPAGKPLKIDNHCIKNLAARIRLPPETGMKVLLSVGNCFRTLAERQSPRYLVIIIHVSSGIIIAFTTADK